MSKQDNLTDFLTDVADAIREKKGSSEKINPQNFSEEIRSIESGEKPSVEEKDVNFYDYDGTLLFSYTIPEAQALTELPTPKGHEGLVFDGWNWDYEDVVALDYPMNIGAMWRTDDGATRLYLEVEEPTKINFHCKNTGELTVDFGDGRVETTTASTVDIEHTYEVGSYVMRLSGTERYMLENLGGTNIFGNCSDKSSRLIHHVRIGGNCVINGHAFRGCSELETVSVPIKTGVYSLGSSYSFQFCSRLKHLNFTINTSSLGYFMIDLCTGLKHICCPKNFNFNSNNLNHVGIEELFMSDLATKINCSGLRELRRVRLSPNISSTLTSTFSNCHLLRSVHIPDGVNVGYAVFSHCWLLEDVVLPQTITTIASQLFYYCRLLRSVKIPKAVKSVGANSFNNCTLLVEIDFSDCESVPTLENTNAFSDISSTAVIIVPDNLYDEWIAATNWSSFDPEGTNQIIKASEYNQNN